MDAEKEGEYIHKIISLEKELEEERAERELIELENANLEGQIIVYKEIINKLIRIKESTK